MTLDSQIDVRLWRSSLDPSARPARRLTAVTRGSPVHEMTADEFRRVTEVTYLGAVHGTLSALRRMRQRDAGVIVQVGSALAYRSIPLQSAYCAAKHALRGFTESLRTELIHQRSGVGVTIVHLPALNTPQFGWVRSRLPRKAQPVPPIFQPEVAAEAIVWAAEHVPRELDVGAPTELAILAEKLAPGSWIATSRKRHGTVRCTTGLRIPTNRTTYGSRSLVTAAPEVRSTHALAIGARTCGLRPIPLSPGEQRLRSVLRQEPGRRSHDQRTSKRKLHSSRRASNSRPGLWRSADEHPALGQIRTRWPAGEP